MQVHILGAHNLESSSTRLPCLVVDGVLALDAGSLTSGLSFAEQDQIRAILLSHQHFDHIRDINTFGLTHSYQFSTPVYAPTPVLEAVTSLFRLGLYPDFTQFPPEKPALKLLPLEPYKEERVLDYTVVALPVPHSVPAFAYEVHSPTGRRLFYSGDVGKGLATCWPHVSPHLIITEALLPRRLEEWAERSGHLSTELLLRELRAFRVLKGYLPPVVLVHLSPPLEKEIEEEVRGIAQELGSTITLGQEGMKQEV